MLSCLFCSLWYGIDQKRDTVSVIVLRYCYVTKWLTAGLHKDSCVHDVAFHNNVNELVFLLRLLTVFYIIGFLFESNLDYISC